MSGISKRVLNRISNVSKRRIAKLVFTAPLIVVSTAIAGMIVVAVWTGVVWAILVFWGAFLVFSLVLGQNPNPRPAHL